MSKGIRRGGRRSLADRQQALQNLSSLLGRLSPEDAFERAAAKADVTLATMHQWHTDASRGELHDPDAPAAKPAPVNGKKVRKQYSPEFKKEAIAAYQANSHLEVGEVAQSIGVGKSLLSRWASEAGVGRKAAARLARPEHAALAKATRAAIQVAPPRALTQPQQLTLPPIETADLHARIRVLEGKLSQGKELMHHLVEMAMSYAP